MNNREIRDIFYSFFKKKGHHKVLSSPLVPAKDPSILFTNAGMNQFKDVFLQKEKRGYSTAVSIQKCMRVSGKHNDFDEVGKTEFHHTFFEMMGNFSFGDYFKEKAIEYGWELLTKYYNFNPEDLWVTVYKEDDEAFKIWEQQIGVPAEKIIPLGQKDNFWQMGDTGPCGPCSEIHFDRGEKFGPAQFLDENKRFIEIWNLVFMQYFKDSKGELNPLPAPSIDTGMGIERLSSLLMGTNSNYQTDLFKPIIEFTANSAGIPPDHKNHQVDLKVIADHIRALTFLISDGVLPANDGRGYVLRRLLRRAAKHGKSLGFTSPFLAEISAKVIEIMKDFYPELEQIKQYITNVIKPEEERFNRTLTNGLNRFDELLEKALAEKGSLIPGDQLFKLSDTYGFPLDFAVDLANERDIGIDYEGYKSALEKQRKTSRANTASKIKVSDAFQNLRNIQSHYTGHESLTQETTVTAILRDNQEVKNLTQGEEGFMVFADTPFYAESGGQVGDIGSGKNEKTFFEINNTLKTENNTWVHDTKVNSGTVSVNDRTLLKVDENHRKDTATHHTATHLLHSALKEILGLHIKQAGSYVGPDKLRFDFTHFRQVSHEELKKIESLVNEKVRHNILVSNQTLEYETAINNGAIAIFEEKYSDIVRVVKIEDFSMELCGGTHLQASGEIGIFKIVNESSISSGIRRIEAVAGKAGFLYVQNSCETLALVSAHFNQKQENLFDTLMAIEHSLKEKEKLLKNMQTNSQKTDFDHIISQSLTVNGANLIVYHLDDRDRKQLGSISDTLKNRTQGIVVISSNMAGKSAIVISVATNFTKKINASIIIKEIAAMVNGNGGGRPDFAQAGGEKISNPVKFKHEITDIITKQFKHEK